MGKMADLMVSYAQPLLDKTDGSLENMQYALSIAQMCWNLALLPEKERNAAVAEMQSVLGMEEKEFSEFRESVIVPMINIHHAMFPNMSPSNRKTSSTLSRRNNEKYPGTGRNQPCPCGSGKKYKRCCGK